MKKFLIKISYTILPMWLFLTGLTIYYNFYIKPRETKEFGALGKIDFGEIYNEQIPDKLYYTIKKSPETVKNCSPDVLTIGDSFSQQGKIGYQNFIAQNGISVINYEPYNAHMINPFQSAYDLINQNYLDSMAEKTLIVETVERNIILWLKFMTFDNNRVKTYEKPKQTKISEQKEAQTNTQKSLLIEAKNFLMMNLNVVKKPTRHCKLTKDLFVDKFARDLYFYQNDIENGTTIPSELKSTVKQNLGRLFNKAEEKRINIKILIAVDKYDLYQDYIENNPYQPKTVNEEIEKLTNGDPRIIYTKKILKPYIDNGEKDIFYVNDSHWTAKSATIVGNYLVENLK